MPLDLNDPTAVLLAVVDAFHRAGIAGAVYGGLALAAYGEPRETRDADLAVLGVSGDEALVALRAGGIEAVLGFERVRFGGHLVTRITLFGSEGDSGLNVADLIEPRSGRYAAAALGRAIAATLRGQAVTVLSPEDFVVFKVLSTRERDLEDGATVLRTLGTAVDLALIEREVTALAEEISDHDVVGRFARLLTAARG